MDVRNILSKCDHTLLGQTATWEDIKKWSNEKQMAYYKDSIKYAADKWGKDEVSSWLGVNNGKE